jgi:transcriptional repressor NrdR
LAKSLFTALKKRPIDNDTTEKVVTKISRELEEMGQSEVQSSVVGKKVMDALKELDKIAYIRFASVYTNFKEVEEFEDYIGELDGNTKK